MPTASARWAGSGLAWLTGDPEGPGDFSRADVLTRAAATAAGISHRLGIEVDAACILAGRAGLLGLRRHGRSSPGGATQLLKTIDGWFALTLSRPDDMAAVPALIENDESGSDIWSAVAAWASGRSTTDTVERAKLLDLPVGGLGEACAEPPRVITSGTRGAPRPVSELLIADLSSMWAGPLCGQLFATAGATVVKVESPSRPDGARTGNRRFFDWMNHGKLSAAMDFGRDAQELGRLIEVADIVIEGSRPEALRRRGLGPQDISGPSGRVWLQMTGHGGDAGRPAFGDDAAVAGGLVGRGRNGPVLCADAIADPLSGLEATSAVLDSLERGGGEVITVSMAAVAATHAALPLHPMRSHQTPSPPCPPPPCAPASALGADRTAVEELIRHRLARTC